MPADPFERVLTNLDQRRAPSPAFAEALLARLLEQLETGDDPVDRSPEDHMTDTIAGAHPAPPVGVPRPRDARGRHDSRWRRAIAHVATAAIILLMIGAAATVFQAWYGSGLGDDSPGVRDELLVRVEEPALPNASAGQWTGLERVTIAPGAETPINLVTDMDDGVYLFVVESGLIAFTADGPASVVAAGDHAAEPTRVEPGAVVSLAAGDRGAIQAGTRAHWRNAGSDPATILTVSLSTVVVPPDVDGVAWVTLVDARSLRWPESPATFELHRVTLEPGREFPVDALPGLALVYVETGAFEAPLGTADQPRTRAFEAGDGMVATDWRLRAGGSLRNGGGSPTVLYVLTMVGADTTATPAP